MDSRELYIAHGVVVQVRFHSAQVIQAITAEITINTIISDPAPALQVHTRNVESVAAPALVPPVEEMVGNTVIQAIIPAVGIKAGLLARRVTEINGVLTAMARVGSETNHNE